MFNREEADRMAAEWRYIITDMICQAGSGHIGGALSLVEVMHTLYFRSMHVDPDNPADPTRDRLVLSKGHAAPVLYVALAYKGFFPANLLGTMNADGTTLPSHADARTVPGIDATTGSLGQGLSVACGMATAAKMGGGEHHIFCIIGDGETNEGQNWEAGMFAAHNDLDNLVAITDYNKLQIDGFTDDVLSLEPLADKWRAFGWEVFEMDGHDWDDINCTIEKAKAVEGKPAMILAHTIKGKGCCKVENTAGSHNIKVPDQEAYDGFMGALDVQDVTLPY
ncbi:MAG: transketolase [Lentisphaerae bacterium]|nr:transketolase [Lentisphaerota bacterium]MBT4818500.1 transketolase [Lentisphaerota bacterium]MBT5611848.1 transketolase [Lentisphaerota bacterium]MBT7059305.1 transketolase [Lentisphaerota bacterium]MBT7843828.1 transketolase [Lentisphaerota bacterium]